MITSEYSRSSLETFPSLKQAWGEDTEKDETDRQ